MAHRESIQDKHVKGFLFGQDYFWAVSSAVGYTCRNKKEDVLLVQFFLNKIINQLRQEITVDIIAGTEPSTTPFKGIPKQLVPDGDFGGKTWGAIKWLQRECIVPPMVADGMVSAADGTKALTPKNKRFYTIYVLNHIYASEFQHYFHDIRSDPDLPPLLCTHLSGPLPDLV